jgi:hypothetical protein
MEYFIRRSPRAHARDPYGLFWPTPRSHEELVLSSPWVGHAFQSSTVHRKFSSLALPFLVVGKLVCVLRDRDSPKWVQASAEVRCEVVIGLRRRTLWCKELILRCDQGPNQDLATAICLQIFTVMAAPLRRFLHEVANEWESRYRDCNRAKRVGPVHRIMLLLPAGSRLPNEAEELIIWEALSCILALVWGKPSGVTIAVATETTRSVHVGLSQLLSLWQGRG